MGNNSISCLYNSVSCFQTSFELICKSLTFFEKKGLMIGGKGVGEMIPYTVCMIPFPVLKGSPYLPVPLLATY